MKVLKDALFLYYTMKSLTERKMSDNLLKATQYLQGLKEGSVIETVDKRKVWFRAHYRFMRFSEREPGIHRLHSQ